MPSRGWASLHHHRHTIGLQTEWVLAGGAAHGPINQDLLEGVGCTTMGAIEGLLGCHETRSLAPPHREGRGKALAWLGNESNTLLRGLRPFFTCKVGMTRRGPAGGKSDPGAALGEIFSGPSWGSAVPGLGRVAYLRVVNS